MFELTAHLDGLRCQETAWLLARDRELEALERRVRVERLFVVRILDERGAIDEGATARSGVSVRTVRETVECARALESLPEIAAVAHAGGLSDEQLRAVTQLADESTDAEWARRAPKVSPSDLARLARSQQKPTVEDAVKRREARSWRWWWQPDRGMLSIRGELPDVDGALFEATLHRMIDRMHPAKGQSWDKRERRAADALVELCERFADVESPVTRSKPLLLVEVPLHGPAEVAGIPLPDVMVEKLRADAAIEPVLVADGVPVVRGAKTAALSPKITRAVLLRDGHCRFPGCDRRTGLQIHHLVPRSWVVATRLPTSPRCAPAAGPTITPGWSPTGPGSSPATPTNPTDFTSKHSTNTTPARVPRRHDPDPHPSGAE